MEDDMTDVIEKVDRALKKMENIEEQIGQGEEEEGEQPSSGSGSRVSSAKSSTSRAGSARSAID